MLCRLALLTLLGTVSACDAPPQAKAPSQPPPQEAAPPAALSAQRVRELSEQCERKARERFRRDRKDGARQAAEGQAAADFAHRYNAKLDACFYLLKVATPASLSKTLYDIDEDELYGEYLGPATDESPPARFPDRCRVVGTYCASGREWEVLAGHFMEH